MKSPRYRRPRAPSSVLAALGTLQLGALGLLLRGDFMDSLPNYYLAYWIFHAITFEWKVLSKMHNLKSLNETHAYLTWNVEMNDVDTRVATDRHIHTYRHTRQVP